MREFNPPKEALFPLGQLYATPGALEILGEDEAVRFDAIDQLLQRHARGDWGEVCEEDAEANRAAVREESRILSVYKIEKQTVWIITEADRSATTILLPDEY